MARETRIAMLVGLLFIVMFGLVLSGLTQSKDAAPPPPSRLAGHDRPIAEVYAPIVAAEEPKPAPVAKPPAGPEESEPIAAAPPGPTTKSTVVQVALHPPSPPSMLTAVDFSLHEQGEQTLPAAPPASSLGDGTAPAPAVAPAAPVAPPVKTYKVQAKDSLIKLAHSFYGAGNENLYTNILQANKKVLKTAKSPLLVGMELVIPPPPASVKAVAVASVQPGQGGASVPSGPGTPAVAPASPAGAPVSEMTVDELHKHFSASAPAPSGKPADKTASRKPSKGSGKTASADKTATADKSGPSDKAGAPKSPDDFDPPPPKATDRFDCQRSYTVQQGDSLYKIAREKFGNNNRETVQKLFNANRDKLSSINDIPAGVKLDIPS